LWAGAKKAKRPRKGNAAVAKKVKKPRKGNAAQHSRSKAATAPEYDLENTDNEQEPEETETREDREFVHDSDMEDEAGLHAAVDNARHSEDEGGQERVPYVPEEPADKKRTGSERRVLLPLLERGMAGAPRNVSEYYCKAPYGLPTPNRLVTPYWYQQGHERLHSQLVSGAFGSDMHRAWCNDTQGQGEFAMRFSTPWEENIALRPVSTDIPDTILDPLSCSTNSTAKILHAIKVTHKQTELDLINSKFIQNVFMGLQKTSRELALAMHSGPFGGIQGKADVVLWNMRHGDEVSNTSQDILNLVELIRYCALRVCLAPRMRARLTRVAARGCRAHTGTSCGRASARFTRNRMSAGSAACIGCRTERRRFGSTTTTRPPRAA
jgi:hypothetical protein